MGLGPKRKRDFYRRLPWPVREEDKLCPRGWWPPGEEVRINVERATAKKTYSNLEIMLHVLLGQRPPPASKAATAEALL